MISYDDYCKNTLKNKEVLWFLMKNFVSEYKNSSKEEILKSIENGDLSKKYIDGITSEDLGINKDDNAVIFDILFTSKLPNSNDSIGLFINIEAQNNYHPGYPIVKRALYYASRLLAKQNSNSTKYLYRSLKKVYSIWICISPSIKDQNTVTSYNIHENYIVGSTKENINNYDLMNVIMIYLANNKFNNVNELIKPLNVLFKEISEDDKRNKQVLSELKTKYNICIDESEVKGMQNLSLGFIQQGKREGKKEGKLEDAISCIDNLMSKKHMSFDDALKEASDLLNISKDIKEKVIKHFNN